MISTIKIFVSKDNRRERKEKKMVDAMFEAPFAPLRHSSFHSISNGHVTRHVLSDAISVKDITFVHKVVCYVTVIFSFGYFSVLTILAISGTFTQRFLF